MERSDEAEKRKKDRKEGISPEEKPEVSPGIFDVDKITRMEDVR